MDPNDAGYDSVDLSDDNDGDEQYHDAGTNVVDPSANSSVDGNNSDHFEDVDDDDWLERQEDNGSHFSSSSSSDEEDEWNAADALEQFRTATEAMQPTANNANDLILPPNDNESVLPTTSYNDDNEPDPEQFEGAEKKTEETAYQFDERPWLSEAYRNGALIPFAGLDDDEIYRRDVRFFRRGWPDTRRSSGPVAHSNGKPSLMGTEGLIQRMRAQLDEVKHQRDAVKYECEQADEEVRMLKHDWEQADEEVRMLKHAVDTRDNRLLNLNEAAKGWKNSSDRWEKAFEEQRPLADAERERKEMREAGIEASRSIGTQISPSEVAFQEAQIVALPPSPTLGQYSDSAAQTDSDVVDIDRYFDLARELDSVHEEKNKLSGQNRRLKAILAEMKDWTEDRTFVLKTPVLVSDNLEGAETDSVFPSDDSASLARNHIVKNDSVLPHEWASPTRPDKWAEREADMRKSQSWIKAKNACAARLDAWEQDLWEAVRAGMVGAVG